MPSPSLGASGPATSSAYPLGSVPAAPATPPAPAGPPDPIAEAPNAVWYVRPPSGGQFGPAAGDVMRSWIGEGRVSADTLVWREGWRDWQEASAVFPNLGGSQELLPGVVAVSPTARGAGVAHGGSGDRLKARRRAKNLQVGVMVVLALAVVVLIGVFVWVLGQAPPTPKPVSDGPVPPATSGPPAPDTPPMKQAEPPKP